jgi:hypothetical protein
LSGPAAAKAAGGGGDALAPLRHRVFAVLWAATVLGNIGTWFSSVGSGWQMTALHEGSEPPRVTHLIGLSRGGIGTHTGRG